jgi:hypothetical protein
MSTDTELVYNDINQLTHFWSKDGLPVFVADIPNIIEVAKSLGYSFFYVMATHQKIEKAKPVSNPSNKNFTQPLPDIITETTKFFQVISNFVGESIVEVDKVDIQSLNIINSSTSYSLPPIPKSMVEKLDQFFRSVEKSHDSEAIVLLTFDPSYEDSQGWGVLVPDQENNAAHCSYDPVSVAENKPDNVYIVGSVHSHPSMAAYASGTDHKDQAGFDGLHITFGWQPSVSNNATQYHIELQMGGKIFTLRPDQVFEQDYYFDPDPEVLEWVSKVKKELPPSFMGGAYTNNHLAPLQTPHKTTQTDLSSKKNPKLDSSQSINSLRIHYSDLMPEYALETFGLIIAEVPDKISFPNIECYCPCCGSELFQEDLWQGSCPDCDIMITAKGDPKSFIQKLVEDYCFDKQIDMKKHKVHLWGHEEDSTSWLMEIDLSLNAIDDSDLINTSSLYDSDILDIYSDTSKCNSCAHFYGTSCPAYALAIENYNLGKIDYDNLHKSVTGEDCSSYVPFNH